MADLYKNLCNFSNSLTNATNGWDSVYAILYSTINQDIRERRQWQSIKDGLIAGAFNQSGDTGEIKDAIISSIAVVRGGQGQNVNLDLGVSSAEFDSGNGPVTLGPFVVHLRTQLVFAASPSQPGLHHLTVDTQKITVLDLDGATLDTDTKIHIKVLMDAFVLRDDFRSVMSLNFAQVLTKDYAESVNIPWLSPQTFAYAVTDRLGPADGILAVFANVGPTAGKQAVFDPLAFPNNPDVNAAVLISSERVADSSFVAQLNQAVGSATLGSFSYNPATGSLANDRIINAFYRIADNGEVALIPPSAVASSTGVTHAVTIPPGAMTFTIADDAITVQLTTANVDLGDGYGLVLTMKSDFQLIVNPTTQNIDIMLSGQPVVTTSFNMRPASAKDELAKFGITAGSIAIGEFISFGIGRFSGFLSNANAGEKQLVQYGLDYIAACRQLKDQLNDLPDPEVVDGDQAPLNPRRKYGVSFNIGGLRDLRIASGTEPTSITPLQQAYSDSVRLNPKWQGPRGPGSATGQVHPVPDINIEMTGQALRPNNGDVNVTVLDGNDPEPPAPVNVPPTAAERHAELLPHFIFDIVNNLPERFQSTLRKACTSWTDTVYLPSAADQRIGGMLDAMFQSLNGNELNNSMNFQVDVWKRNIKPEDYAQLYEGAVKFCNENINSGAISLSEYIHLVQGYWDYTLNPDLQSPIFDTDTRIHLTSVNRISGEPTRVAFGFLGDLEVAQGQERAGLIEATIRKAILQAPRPFLVKGAGLVCYIAGLVIGYFVNDVVTDKLPGADGGRSANADSKRLASGGAAGPASLLFSNVSFPLMTTFTEGATTGPTPASVLACAGVNGGLILGVAIQTNL